MPGEAESGGSTGFSFRALGKPEELRAAEELQRTAALGADEGAVPVPVMRAMQDQGGLVLGAFADIHLAAVSVGFLGWDGGALYHYLQRFVVRPEYQNHGLGRSMGRFLAGQVRQQGLETVRGTFDPLASRAAFFAVHRLGALPEKYLVHYYGQLGAPEGVDHESDRLRWAWAVGAADLDDRLTTPPVRGAAPDPRFAGAPDLLETETADSGLRLPTSVAEPTTPMARLAVPFDIDLIRQHEPSGVRRWRHAVRDAFRAAFDVGYRVVDFDVLREAHERSGVYLLAAPGPSAPPSAPPPA